MGPHLLLRRPARQLLDDGSADHIAVPTPPRENDDDLDRQSWTQAVLPMVGMFGMIGFILYKPNPLFVAVGVLWMFGWVGATIGMRIDTGRRQKKKRLRTRRRYVNQLADVRADVRASVRKQWSASARRHPAPADLVGLTRCSNRLWERRRDHEDFLSLRYGIGQAILAADLKVPPESTQMQGYDPVCEYELTRLLSSVVRVDGAPLTVELRTSRWTVLAGDQDRSRALARALLAQAAFWHGPDDLRLLVAVAPERVADWAWTRWLPHLRWCESDLAEGSLMITRAGVLEQVLTQLASSRQSENAARQGSSMLHDDERVYAGRHLLVVVDGLPLDEEVEAVQILSKATGLGVTVIEIADPQFKWESPWVDRVLVVDADGVLTRGPLPAHDFFVGSHVDGLDLATSEVLARRLAPWRIPGESLSDSVRSPDVTELLGLQDLDRLSPENAWRPLSEAEQLTIPMGSSPDGAPVVLDLKESAQGGMGPHGLMVGATGSGKSELLRTLVVGMAMRHSPELLSFVLVDFKGGATFSGLSDLPQVSAVITNLEDQLDLVDRLHDALNGELGRRQEMLSSAGNVASATEYRRLRESRPELGLAPMPSVLVIVDEFSELITARPDFVDTFVAIGRVGRSLGIHLLLASQRLEEGKLRGLESHVSYRIALRTFSPADSSAAIGVRDAYYLPSVPGSGILTVGTTVFQRFRAAHVSAPYDAATAANRRGLITRFDPTSRGFGLVRSPQATDLDRATDPDTASATREASTIATVAVQRLHDESRRVHRIWLPPLERRIELGSVLKDVRIHPDRGVVAYDWRHIGQLKVPMGLVDQPRQQKQEILAPSLAGANGSMLIVGAPQTGKSTFCKNIVVAAALTHAPTEMQFYCIDLGGSGLLELDRLPHVGSVCARTNRDKIIRTVGFIRSAMDAREQLFASRNIGTMEQYRQMRRDGALPAEVLGDVYLMIDGYLEFRDEYEDLGPVLLDVASRGPGLGFHLIVATARSMDVRANLRDNIAERVELYINDPMDSMIERRVAAIIPRDCPGRGITHAKQVFQGFVPMVDLPGAANPGGGSLRELVGLVEEHWHGARAPEIKVLPSRLGMGDLPDPESDVDEGVPVGLEERNLEPARLELSANEPHLIALGDSESGKTNLLRTYLQGLVARRKPDQAAVFVVDYRLTLFEAVPPEYLRGYSSSATSTQELVSEVVQLLTAREPAPGMTSSQLRARSWWDGPEIYLVVDDYDLVVPEMENILAPLSPFIPNGHEYGFHLLAARKSGGASRALYDPVLGRMKEFGSPGIQFSGDRLEGQLLGGERPMLLPQGRGLLIHRRQSPVLVQVAWSGEEEEDDTFAHQGVLGHHAAAASEGEI